MWTGEALFVNYWVYLQFVLWRTASEERVLALLTERHNDIQTI